MINNTNINIHDSIVNASFLNPDMDLSQGGGMAQIPKVHKSRHSGANNNTNNKDNENAKEAFKA